MISFALRCANGHGFDSWFASNAAFDTLSAAGHVRCIDCGSPEVRKALMAPSVTTDRPAPRGDLAVPRGEPDPGPAVAPARAPAPGPAAMASGDGPLRALAALRRHVERTATYVGTSFATEVRAIDAGAAPERAIWGEVTATEARALVDDGLPVAPLPFGPRSKAH